MSCILSSQWIPREVLHMLYKIIILIKNFEADFSKNISPNESIVFKTPLDLNDSDEREKMLKTSSKISNQVKSYASFKIMLISK